MELICDRSGFYEQPRDSTFASPAQWLIDVLHPNQSDTGIPINWKSALSLSAAWYCVNTIAGDIAQLPLGIYERLQDETSKEDRTHPAGKVLRNPMIGSVGAFQFRYLMQNHALISGNGRAFIQRNGRKEPEAFIPLPAENTYTATIYNAETDLREKWHVVYPEKGGEPIPLPDKDVFHVFRFTWDGYNGVAPLDLLKNSFGLGIAGDKFVAKFFKQGGTPSFILEAPVGTFREQAKAEEFLRRFNEYHSGLDNANRVGLLREGIQAKVLGADNGKSQLKELRDYQVRDIMRVFGIPMIPGVADSQSYNTLEQLNRAYLLHCLGPWQRVWEEECARKLLTDREQRAETYFFMFDSWELVKPDANQRADMLSKLVGSMIITPNEARDWEGLPPMDGGDKLLNPATTSGNNNNQESEPDEDEDDGDEEELVAARLRPLVNAEIRRVNEMSSKARDFLSWSDSFYEKHEPRMREAVASVGGPEWIATEYIEYSKSQIRDLFTGGGTAADFTAITAAWPARVGELAAQICEARA